MLQKSDEVNKMLRTPVQGVGKSEILSYSNGICSLCLLNTDVCYELFYLIELF
jgi:hypothetical protein